MSAINPASFASPTLGIQAPSGIGPGAVGVGRAGGGGGQDRRQAQQAQEQLGQTFVPGGPAGRGFRPTATQPFGADPNVAASSGFPPTGFGFSQGGAHGNPRGGAYMSNTASGADAFAGAYQGTVDYQSMRRFASPQGNPSPGPHNQGTMPMTAPGDWTTSFRGLSLNSH